MSKMIPRESIDAFRQQLDVTVDLYGIECTLYIPTTTSSNTAEKLDVYTVPADYATLSYTAQVFIEWNPDMKRLRKLGLFTEKSAPILAWFGRKATALEGSPAGEIVTVDPLIHSWFSIAPEFVPGSVAGAEEFELIDIVVPPHLIHDAIIGKGFKIAPRRVNS